MPDLHGWITQQIDDREQLAALISPGGYAPDEWRIEPSRSGRWVEIVAYSRTNIEPPEAASREQAVALTQTGRNEHLLIAMHDPASVLRRCAADRKILEHHAPAGTECDPYACNGCGVDSEYGHEVDHTNDCPTLQALAEGYGLTEEQRAALDRPERERPVYPGKTGDVILDSIASMYAGLLLGTRPVLPRPEVKAMKILEPELKKIPGYVPTTNPEA
ncbi:DUF6221 family protein [Streptomyces sp. AMCC400023]|uniref:DUF6221 family protein n=1 Tax=Streptomyces sp. AMCC400023 TaxID=2056258 RepID=UPI001F179AF9|nr:DUF6221 family protein [Streptomyces sp. AMCC400023]